MGWLNGTGNGRSPSQYVWIVLGMATAVTAMECVRGNLFTGLPWLYLGHTQSPLLAACQIADIFGVYGITFCVAALNALFLLYLRVGDRRALGTATTVIV